RPEVSVLGPFARCRPGGVRIMWRQAHQRLLQNVSNMIGVGRIDWVRSPLPPNRTCGSPASGSPVGGSPRQGLTCRSEAMVRIPIPANGTENRRDWSPVALMSKAVNMHLVCAASLSHALIPWLSPICFALGHSHRSAFCQPRQYIHLPAPLCSRSITALLRSYGCSDSCRPALRLFRE